MPIELAEQELRERLLAYLRRPRHFRVPDVHTLCHKAEHYLHMSYLAFVYYEGHSHYAKIAGVLFCVTVVSLFIGEGEGGAE